MAAEETVLTWSVANWITITLMAAIGFALVGFGVKLYQGRNAGSGK